MGTHPREGLVLLAAPLQPPHGHLASRECPCSPLSHPAFFNHRLSLQPVSGSSPWVLCSGPGLAVDRDLGWHRAACA